MLRVFNCGIGMALVVDDAAAATACCRRTARRCSPSAASRPADGPASVAIGDPRAASPSWPAAAAATWPPCWTPPPTRPFRPRSAWCCPTSPAPPRWTARGPPACRRSAIDHRPFGRDREAHERAIDAALAGHGIELVCLAGYMRLLTPWLVERWAGRMLNIHPSLLPAFPGLHTHERALAAGCRLHGCTVHLVTAVMDEGPILAQAAVPVLPGDTPDTLAARVLAQEHRLYPAALAAFVTGEPRRPAGQRALLNPLPVRAHARPRNGPIARSKARHGNHARPRYPGTEPGPAIDDAFVADRQAFWGSFTRFVTMGAIAVVVLLILMAFFLG